MRRLLIFAKLGFRSIGRLGITAFLCLSLGFTLLGFSIRDFSEISAEKEQTCTVIAQAGSISDEQILSAHEIDGVLNCTAVIVVQAQLYIGDNYRDLTVYAVDPSWIDEITVGDVFPENSTMPYIVLSEKALEGFKDKTGKTVFSDSVDWKNGEIVLNGFHGEVCGIVSEETAVGYISHSAAEAMLLFNGEIPAYTQLWLKLENSGYEEDVINELSVTGLMATSEDSAKWQVWKTETYNSFILCLSGIAIILSSVAIIHEKTKNDALTYQSEYTFLRQMGAKKLDIICIISARILLLIAISISVSIVLCQVISVIENTSIDPPSMSF